eukprot:3036647-Rhodomonas_salina.1
MAASMSGCRLEAPNMPFDTSYGPLMRGVSTAHHIAHAYPTYATLVPGSAEQIRGSSTGGRSLRADMRVRVSRHAYDGSCYANGEYQCADVADACVEV